MQFHSAIPLPAIPLLLSCLLLGACRASPAPTEVAFAPADATLWLVYRDWHTSLLIDADLFRRYSREWQRHAALQLELEAARVVRVGWGDGDYFTGKSKSTGTATLALFASHYSALQFMGYTGDPLLTIPSETRAPLRVSEANLAALVAYIDASLRQEGGMLVPLQSYVENAGVFFESNKHYGLFNNCNTWSGEALQSAGLPVRSALHLTPSSIFEQARAIAALQRAMEEDVMQETVSVP
ncbi:MAG: DUF2459 domain-containing protein [Pseudomonadales bacterium]|nr:DUF2459 domain-containing protein [Pseudomonadales bacterium]